MVCGPEIARSVEDFEASLPYNLETLLTQQTKHHEQTPSAQNRFSNHVNNLVNAIEQAGNPFFEESQDLMALDSKNITSESAVEILRSVAASGNKQFGDFLDDRLNKSIYSPIKQNKFSIFTQPTKSNKSSTKDEITSLKKSCQLFSRLYIACQVRDGDLAEFFSHENGSFPPSISKIQKW